MKHRTPKQKAALDARLVRLVETTDFSMKDLAEETGITYYYAAVILGRLNYRRRWVSPAEWETIVSWRTDEKRMRS